MVSVAPPEIGPFGLRVSVTAGASNVKIFSFVPTIPVSVNEIRWSLPQPLAPWKHNTVVGELHEVVEHNVTPT